MLFAEWTIRDIADVLAVATSLIAILTALGPQIRRIVPARMAAQTPPQESASGDSGRMSVNASGMSPDAVAAIRSLWFVPAIAWFTLAAFATAIDFSAMLIYWLAVGRVGQTDGPPLSYLEYFPEASPEMRSFIVANTLSNLAQFVFVYGVRWFLVWMRWKTAGRAGAGYFAWTAFHIVFVLFDLFRATSLIFDFYLPSVPLAICMYVVAVAWAVHAIAAPKMRSVAIAASG